MTTQLKVLYWNIHGIHSTTIGEKQKDPKFQEVVSHHDIICISELHTDIDISIQGFTVLKQKFRKKNHKGPKIGGGIAVYARQNMAKNFELIPTSNADSIWVKTVPTTGETIQLGFFYCSPEKVNSKVMETVNGEVQKLASEVNTYILGDFNARTKTECENLIYDKSDEDLGVPSGMLEQDMPLPRNSEDAKPNARGREFLDLCRMNDLCIANGRTIGDLFGKYTCHQSRGSSVVDYLIVPYRSLPNVRDFTVGEFLPSLSDHCPLTSTTDTRGTKLEKDNVSATRLYDLPNRYIWKKEDDKTFTEKLVSDEFEHEVQKLMAMKDNPDLIKNIQNLLTKAADECNIKKTRSKPKKQDPPWFDLECKRLKDEIRKHGKALRHQPNDVGTRQTLYFEKRKLRNLVRKNKHLHRKSIVDTMCENLSSGEKKQYWKMLRKLEDPKDQETYMHEQLVVDHFKKILSDPGAKRRMEEVQSTEMNGSLDYKITKEELDIASKILQAGKSPGIDTIINEMIAILLEKYPKLLLKLFNSILKNTWISEEWLVSLITAIHKKGPKENPDNYRGISLMSCLAKLFLTIINNRITEFAVENNILSPNQLGFVLMNRTSDPHIILSNLIQKYCHRGKRKMYGCFVDFSKAFDSVPRDILLAKLKHHGINGKVFEIIKTLYTGDKAGVKFGNKASLPFETTRGVRQGCVLSPLLFNIFLSDIQEIFDMCGSNPKLSDVEISSLIWADDILILSETASGLQRKLDNLGIYCKKNKLQVNTDKTQAMTFTKSGRLLKGDFYFGETKLKNVREYKYLGFIVTPSGEIRTGLEDLRIRAMRALTKIRKALGPLFQHNLRNTMHLYNFMVKPILLYCSDFWGTLRHPQNSPIERLHLSFYKQILGVRKQTKTEAVFLELGTVPLMLHATKMSIKNWDRIREGMCNSLLSAAFEEAVENDLPWITSIKHTFESNGLLQVFLSPEIEVEENQTPYDLLFQRMKDQFQQTAFEKVRNSEKLSLYSQLKTESGAERYLSDVTNIRHRTAMTRLRMSAHSLHIEEGRYTIPITSREDRICTLCKTGVEDETHLLVKCPMYEELRHHMDKHKTTLTSNTLSDQVKTVNILKSKDLQPVAKFVYEAFEKRKVMIDSLYILNDMLDKIDKQEKISAKIEVDVLNAVTKMVNKVVNSEKSAQNNKKYFGFYAVKNVSDDGLKLTLSKIPRGPHQQSSH